MNLLCSLPHQSVTSVYHIHLPAYFRHMKNGQKQIRKSSFLFKLATANLFQTIIFLKQNFFMSVAVFVFIFHKLYKWLMIILFL